MSDVLSVSYHGGYINPDHDEMIGRLSHWLWWVRIGRPDGPVPPTASWWRDRARWEQARQRWMEERDELAQLRAECERLRAENLKKRVTEAAAFRAFIEAEIVGWLRLAADDTHWRPRRNEWRQAAVAIVRGEHREKR